MSANVIHGFWAPEKTSNFFQSDSFRVWVETPNVAPGKSNHHFHCQDKQLVSFLESKLSSLVSDQVEALSDRIRYYPQLLPTQQADAPALAGTKTAGSINN